MCVVRPWRQKSRLERLRAVAHTVAPRSRLRVQLRNVAGERRRRVGDRAWDGGTLGSALDGAAGRAVMPHFNGISMGLDVYCCI